MHIYVDESGLFIPTQKAEAWCVVAAFMLPENDIRKLKIIISRLKVKSGKTYKDEIKLREIKEEDYFKFLGELNGLNGSLYCTASNMTETTQEELSVYKVKQAEYIMIFIDKLTNEEVRNKTIYLSEAVKKLSNQLYMQLVCQVELFDDVIRRGILYHVQRSPKFLNRFVWRIDQKNSSITVYENTFQTVLPEFLQTMSLQKLSIKLSDCDYGAMKEYIFKKEEKPNYLKEEYGIDTNADGAFKIHKILNDNFMFSDSKSEEGIQAVDLLASGIRRLLRGEFKDQNTAASLLGSLMIQNKLETPPINIFSFSGKKTESEGTKSIVENFARFCKPMMVSRRLG